MKGIPVLTACVAATVLGVSGCANPTDAGEAQQQGSTDIIDSVKKDDRIAAMLPEDIRDSGHITVSINPDVEPVKFLDADGNIVGLNPDLLRAAGTVLGVEIDFQEGTFDSMVPGLASKRYDLIASIGDYVERQKQIDFIDYLKSGTGLLASTSVETEIESPKDLCGLAVGYTRGTSQQELVESAAKACDGAG
ncbi:MAG: transporter substrate-binding domain-containing protein, partial [Nocardioidaceae bacterium]